MSKELKFLNRVAAWVWIVIFQMGCGGSPVNETKTRSPKSAEQKEVLVEKLEPSESVVTNSEVSQSVAEMLGLRIVAGSSLESGRDRPDPAVDLQSRTSLDASTIEGNTILLESLLYLRDLRSPNSQHHRNLYFVWPEDSFGSLLQSVIYSHQVFDRNQRELGSLRSFSAWHDTENHRWFIPLQFLFQGRDHYRDVDISPSDIQLLTLELVPERGPSRIVRIQFHAVGPFPQFEFSSVAATQPTGSTNAWIQLASNQGVAIHRDTIHNPTSRSFSVWIRSLPENADSIRLNTYLQESYFESRPSSHPVGPLWNNFRSVARLEERSVIVRHHPGTSEVQRLDNTQWKRIPLSPHENLTLEWKAKAAVSERDCSVPRSSVRHYTWNETPRIQVPGLRPGSKPLDISSAFKDLGPFRLRTIPRSTDLTLEWRVAGGEVVGHWLREIRVTHDFVQEGRDSQAGDLFGSEFLTLTRSEMAGALLLGNRLDSYRSFDCQGIFR